MNRKKQDKAIDTSDMTTATPENTRDKERMDTLQKYVSDMIAVEEHIASAIRRQVNDENLTNHASRAGQIINKMAELTDRHTEDLKRHLEAIGGDKAKGIKEVATAAMGTLAGLYDKVRNEAVSKMLRDDYTALNLATVSYTMLHTTGLAFNDQATASLALRHLQDYTGVIMEINELIPSVVVTDLRDNGALIEESLLQLAISNTQEAWRHHQGMQPASGDSTQPTSSTSSNQPATTKKRSSEASASTPQVAEPVAGKPAVTQGAGGAESSTTTSTMTSNSSSAPNNAGSKTPTRESVAAGNEPASTTATSTTPKRAAGKPRATTSKRTPATEKGSTSTN